MIDSTPRGSWAAANRSTPPDDPRLRPARRAVATGRPSRSRVSGEELADPLVALLHLADELLNEIADLVRQHADVAVLGA